MKSPLMVGAAPGKAEVFGIWHVANIHGVVSWPSACQAGQDSLWECYFLGLRFPEFSKQLGLGIW